MARKKWSEIKKTAAPETIANARRKTDRMSVDLQLDELRRLVGITQEELASRLGINQPNVSKLERREDMYVSSLRDVVSALGGSLEITAQFPGWSLTLGSFGIQQYTSADARDLNVQEQFITLPTVDASSRQLRHWAGIAELFDSQIEQEREVDLDSSNIVETNQFASTGQAA
jgi:transcriptional regulator with XRE-family HTH domain